MFYVRRSLWLLCFAFCFFRSRGDEAATSRFPHTHTHPHHIIHNILLLPYPSIHPSPTPHPTFLDHRMRRSHSKDTWSDGVRHEGKATSSPASSRVGMRATDCTSAFTSGAFEGEEEEGEERVEESSIRM
jgi:hypothetical protein